ncbi:MAG: hypothetical protein ACXVBE_13970 [Bdellovibrionota bacterium]
MKYLMIIAAALTFLPHANAAVPAGQQILLSVNQLESDAQEYARLFADDKDCSIQISRFSEGVRISLATPTDGQVQLDVKYDNAVSYSNLSQFDSSFVKEYAVPGQGSLTAISADDAYFEVIVESHGKKVSCQLDY